MNCVVRNIGYSDALNFIAAVFEDSNRLLCELSSKSSADDCVF